MPVRAVMILLFVLSLFILLFVPPKFRLHTLAGLILLALGGFLLSQPGGEKTGEMRGLIPIEQIEIMQIDLHPSRGVGYELTGKVLNHSPSDALRGLGIELIIKDCMESGEKSEPICTVLEKVQVFLALSIPSGEKGEFNKRLYFKELHPRGRTQWEYVILYTEAKR